MYNMKIKKNFFCGLNIKSSDRNLMDDFENFFDCNIFFKWKRSDLRCPGGWLNSNIDHPYFTHIFLFFSRTFSHFNDDVKKIYICLGKTQSICTYSLFHVIQNSKMELIYLWAEKITFLLFRKWWKQSWWHKILKLIENI